MKDEQESCLMHTPPCIRVNGEWVPQNIPTRQDTFTKVLQALMDVYGVRVTSIHEWSDDANFYILEKVLFEGEGIRIVADESLNPE